MITSEADGRPNIKGRPERRQFLAGLLAIICISVFCGVYSEQRPAYNWDMLAYIAVALVDAGVPLSEVHDITYDFTFLGT